LETFFIRVYESSFLIPVFDENNKIIDVLPFDQDYLKGYKNRENYTHGLHTLLTKESLKSTLKSQVKTKSRNSNEIVCITDSILNAMALYQSLEVPSIVVNSLEIKDEVS
jgi:hypothetical protein